MPGTGRRRHPDPAACLTRSTGTQGDRPYGVRGGPAIPLRPIGEEIP